MIHAADRKPPNQPSKIKSLKAHGSSTNLAWLLPICLAMASLPACGAAASAAAFVGDPPDALHPWSVHDRNRPQPTVVTPGMHNSDTHAGEPPSDAVILFNGTNLVNWRTGKEARPARWMATNGIMVAAPKTGSIRTAEEFGDCQLHIEWSAPRETKGEGQARGNSGIFLMGLCEIQVLDSYHNETYADGHAAALYGSAPPLINALHPPGEFQVYDIVFRRPIFQEGKLVDSGYVTVFVNGVLAQDHTPLEGPTSHLKRARPAPFPDRGPLVLQDHGHAIQFRNIWCRPLPPRAIEGGEVGLPSAEMVRAQRKQIAAKIRADADRLQDAQDPLPGLLRWMESLIYESDEITLQRVARRTTDYLKAMKQIDAERLPAKKAELLSLDKAFRYLNRAHVLPPEFKAKADLETLLKAQHWNKP